MNVTTNIEYRIEILYRNHLSGIFNSIRKLYYMVAFYLHLRVHKYINAPNVYNLDLIDPLFS